MGIETILFGFGIILVIAVVAGARKAKRR